MAYGCLEDKVLNQRIHNSFCDFVCDNEVDKCWTLLRRHEKMAEMKGELWDHFQPVAATYKSISMSTNTSEIWPPSRESVIVYEAASSMPNTPATPELYRRVIGEIHSPRSRRDLAIKVRGQLENPQHSPSEVEYLLGLTSPSFLKEYPVSLPQWLSSQWTDAAGEVLMDATPKFTLLDIHCDRGLSTVSLPLGEMSTLWLIWPDTEHNKALYYGVTEQCNQAGTSRFKRIGAQLTDGIIFVANHTQAVYLPAGYLSLVYTLNGGIMSGMSFSGREDLPSYVECVERELVDGTDVQDLKSTISYLLITMERSLLSPDSLVVYNTACLWMRVMQAMKTAAIRGLDWKSSPSMLRFIQQILIRCREASQIVVDQVCPCGRAVPGPFLHHFATRPHRL